MYLPQDFSQGSSGSSSELEPRPSQGFWGFREKGYLFSGIWGEGSFIFRDLGRKHSFREQGAGG